MSKGIVYVLVNEAFDNFVKIGKTINLEQRLKQLDNTSVPLPFRCVYAIEVSDMDQIEKLAHAAFADHRVRSNREFFEINQQRVISALQMTGGIEVTPKGDIAADDDGLKALGSRKPKRRAKLSDAKLNIGDVLSFTRDESIQAIVINEKQVEFRGKETSVSGAALIILQELGYTWNTVNGWGYWLFDGETIAERLNRIVNEPEEND
jgi:hypothetical protein